MWRILKGFTNIEQIDIAEIEAKYGIKKSQFLDLKSLKGDASDNIPGVPGVGEKTAVKLLNDYVSLDGIYENLDKITGSTKTKLEAGKDSAYMSRTLAKIMFDAPVDLNELKDFAYDEAASVAALKKLQFNSLIRKFTGTTAGGAWSNSVSEDQGGHEKQGFANIATNEELLASEPRNARPLGRELPKANGRERSGLQKPVSVPDVISWNVKVLMHSDKKAAKDILGGATFWDLSQAAFLINPLAREDSPRLVVPEEEYQSQLRELERTPRLYDILTNFDLPLIPVLYKMEEKGMLIDRAYFANLEKEYTKEVAALEKEICKLAGTDFNPNSPIQLGEVLFEKLGLPTKGIKKTTRGYSTGAKELDKLKGSHEVIDKIIEYREASKLLNTYITPIPSLADQNDRIHTTFTQNVTATGRLSSLSPNLQNIPVRTEEGKRIREGFIASPGKVLVSADYSQFELRLAAVLSGDQALINDFNSDIDIHTKTASEAFHVPFNEVTKAQRRAAKVINFGVLYGMSVKGLSDAADMSIPEAKTFIDNYFKLRAPIKTKLDNILKQAEEEGYVETYFGRRRPTPDVKSSNFIIREAAKRAAQNMPIQGTEADLMKRAMIEVDKSLPKGAELIMQVHDSLIVECNEDKKDVVADILKSKMESVAPELSIKLAVEITIGKNWGEL
jgi:DNA polymerase-1